MHHARRDKLSVQRREDAGELQGHGHVLDPDALQHVRGAIVQFGIARVVAGESENFQEQNGLDLMLRHRVEVTNLDLEKAKTLLREFIDRNPREWNGDIGNQMPGS